MPDLGDCTPGYLLVALLKFCPLGKEDTILFKNLFMSRLPESLRVLFSSALTKSVRDLAQRADSHWMVRSSPLTPTINTVEEEAAQNELVEAVNAVCSTPILSGKSTGRGHGCGSACPSSGRQLPSKPHPKPKRTRGLSNAPQMS